MEIQSCESKLYDPVIYVEIKPATKKQIEKYSGGFVWNIVSTPFYYVGKAMGTFSMILGGVSTLKWGRCWPQKWFDKGCWAFGLKPEEPFMHTLASFLIADRHTVQGSAKVIKTILEHHRNDDLFETSASMNPFFKIMQKIWPKEDFSSDDFMITCNKEATELYRTILLRRLKASNLKEFSAEIYAEVKKSAKKWSENHGPVNICVEARFFTARIICRLMCGDSSYSQQVAECVDFFNDYLIKAISKKNTRKDEIKFKEMAFFFAAVIEEILKKENLPLFSEKESTIQHPLFDEMPRKENKTPLSANQKRALIFTTFFAAQETTAALLSWTLRKLALSPELQDELHEEAGKIAEKKNFLSLARQNEAIKRVFAQAIGEFPPAYAISRKIKQDLIMTYRLDQDNKVHRKLLRKNDVITVDLFALAEKALHSGNGEINEHAWTPFGSGKHLCPGEQLARWEISLFIYEITRKYKLQTKNEAISKVGLITLKTSKDIELTVSER